MTLHDGRLRELLLAGAREGGVLESDVVDRRGVVSPGARVRRAADTPAFRWPVQRHRQDARPGRNQVRSLRVTRGLSLGCSVDVGSLLGGAA
jgi:hypothetical protein